MENTVHPGWIRIATVILSKHPVTGAVTEYVRTDTIRVCEVAHYQEQEGDIGTTITLRSGSVIVTDLKPGEFQTLVEDADSFRLAAGHR